MKKTKKEDIERDYGFYFKIHQCSWIYGKKRCQLIGTVGKTGESGYCLWHSLSFDNPQLSQNYNEFEHWRKRLKTQYRIGKDRMLSYVQDEAVWMAIKGEISHNEFMQEYYIPKEKEFLEQEKKELFKFCEDNNLNTVQDHINFIKMTLQFVGDTKNF